MRWHRPYHRRPFLSLQRQPKQHQAAQKVGPDIHCADKWRAIWFGNATHGGVWNQTVQKLAQDKKIIGVYVGDELLGGKITVSNLTAIFDLIKSGAKHPTKPPSVSAWILNC